MFSKYYKPISQTLCKLKTINSVRNVGNQVQSHGKFQEVEIKVPWGKLCGKYWGPHDVQPIIAIHGVHDNACSFDPLATRLPENLSLFAFDLPGHGLSSWIPHGMEYTIFTITQILNQVKEHLKIDKLKLLGHSLGGITSFMYTSIFLNDVKYIIALDQYKPITYKESTILPYFLRYQKTFFKNEKSLISKMTYTKEAAINKMIKSYHNSLDEDLCKILIERGMTKQLNGMLCFNRDPRVLFFPVSLTSSVDHIKILAEQIRCPFMFIRGDQFDRFDNMERYFEALKVIEEHSEDFHSHSISGTHHFHMGNPEPVAALINPFILKHAD